MIHYNLKKEEEIVMEELNLNCLGKYHTKPSSYQISQIKYDDNGDYLRLSTNRLCGQC